MLNTVYFSAKIDGKDFVGKIFIDTPTKKEAKKIAEKYFKLKNIRVSVRHSDYNISDVISSRI